MCPVKIKLIWSTIYFCPQKCCEERMIYRDLISLYLKWIPTSSIHTPIPLLLLAQKRMSYTKASVSSLKISSRSEEDWSANEIILILLMFFSYWRDTNMLCSVACYSACCKLWSLLYNNFMICTDNFSHLMKMRSPNYGYKVWQIKDSHRFFDAPPIQEGWSVPLFLALILGDLCDCSERTIRLSRSGAVPVLGSRPSEAGSFTSLGISCLGYSLSEHSCHAGRSPGHVGRPHIGAPVINPK